MPAATDTSSEPFRLLTTIYRQSWPPPAEESLKNKNEGYSKENNVIVGGSRNGREPRVSPNAVQINRPFSAELISPRRRKKSRLMSSRPSSSLQLVDARPLSSATFEKGNRRKPKIPEYDASKFISESAAARNKALAADYLAMLSGRNYLKKQYREHYWTNDAAVKHRPPSARTSGGVRYATLYPDLGSVIGSATAYRLPQADSTTKPKEESQGRWRLSSSTSTVENLPTKTSSVTSSCNVENVSNVASVGDNTITQTLKRSWSNIPTGQCYRSLSQSNDTLASLCLEGRSASRTSTRTSSLSSSVSLSGVQRVFSTGESIASESPEVVSEKSPANIGHENPKNFVFTGTENMTSYNKKYTEQEEDNELSNVHGMPDSVFDGDNELFRSCETDYDEKECEDEDIVANHPTVNNISYSDLEESDISENEADDYDDDVVDKDEGNRRLQQVNAVFDVSNAAHVGEEMPGPVSITIENSSDNDFSGSEYSWEDEKTNSIRKNEKSKYQFAEFLPSPFKECDVGLFATLPNGMDWRVLTQPSKIRQKKNISNYSDRQIDINKRKRERKTKERESKNRKNTADIVDRLIMLEKMQTMTVQYEQDRRRHNMHRAKSRNSSRMSTNNQSNTSRTASPSTETASVPVRPQSARPARRRSYSLATTPTILNQCNKPRKSVSTTELRIDASDEKPSHDIDLIRLSCTTNHLQYIRRTSSNKRKQRFGITLPRYYEYSWSERLQPNKRSSINSLIFNKPRNCQSCRENERKMAHLHITQMMTNRPRSSYCTFSSEQQKLHPRPNTSTCSKSTSNITSTRPDSRIRDSAKAVKIRESHNSRISVSRSNMPTTFGHAPVNKTAPRSAQDKILSASAILSSVVRDYTNAAKRGNKSSKKSSACSAATPRFAQGSATNNFRSKQYAQVLKPNVIDYTNLRLR